MNVNRDPKTGLVTITFKYDPSQSYPPSKSGKTALVATTGGNIIVPGTDGLLKVGVNAYVPSKG